MGRSETIPRGRGISESEADAGRGPPVLFLHGQPGLGKDFGRVSELLVDDHRVIAPDRPGYGMSGHEPMSMADNAGAMAELLEARKAAPAVVVGHSYGGGIAILLAARRPELVSGLVLVGSVGRQDSVSGFDHLLAAPVVGDTLSAACLYAFGRLLPRLRGLAALAPEDVLERLHASLPDSSYLEVASMPGRQIWRSFVFEQRALLHEIGDVEFALGQIHKSTVVITGEWDAVVRPSVAKSIAASVPGAELVTVDRVGHFVPRDAPDVVAEAVRATEARANTSRIGAD